MGKINVNPDQFFDIIMIYLYDIIVHKDDFLTKDKNIIKFLEVFKKRGMKTQLMDYYLNCNSDRRIDYKRIKNVFFKENAGETNIRVDQKKNLKEEVEEPVRPERPDNFYELKDHLRKCITIMKKIKYKNPNRVITEEMLDNILNKVLINKE